MPCGLSNLTPISAELQLQYEHAKIQGPEGGAAVLPSAERREGSGGGPDSRAWTARGPMQIGHWKQLRVHLSKEREKAR